MKNAISSALGSVVFWKLSIVRCLIYGGIVAWGVFKAGTQGYNHLSDMSRLQQIWLFGDMSVAFGGVVLAFLDTSLQKLSNGNETKVTTETTVTTKP